MTAFDRIEPRLPELMAELAPMSVPDYFDDMLRQTGRTRQRPAWASLERWLHMDVVARPVSLRAPVLRPLLILVLIGLLVVAALAVYAGSQRTRLPEPFGPARNGVILLGDADGDISSYDPVSGTTATLVSGATRDFGPWLSRDSTRFVFLREGSDGMALWLANADGSNQRALVPANVDWFDWSDDDRIVVSRHHDGGNEMSIVNVADGTSQTILPGADFQAPYWRPGHDQLMYGVDEGQGQSAFYIVNADGTGRHPIEGVAEDAIGNAQFSPDGSKLTYSSWGIEQSTKGRIHVLDLNNGADQLLMFDGSKGTTELDPRFSPDGRSLLFERYGPDTSSEGGYQLVAAPADGDGPAIPIGRAHPDMSGGADAEFSPDGTQVLTTYNDDLSTWLLDIDGTGEQQLPWSDGVATWQRLAP